MKKTPAIFAVFLFVSIFLCTVTAQNATEPTMTPTATPQPSPNLFGGAIAIIGLIIVLAIIVLGGYKILRKWTSNKGEQD